MPEARLSYRDIALFFFPLVLNVQLMSISHTIINSVLARLDNYVTALAGMSMAMIIHVFVSSPSYQNHTVTMAMARGRKSMLGVSVYIFTLSTSVALLLALVAYTRIGDLFFQLLGTPAEVVVEARKSLRIMLFLPFISGFRFFCQGLLLQARRTGLISFSTLVRVAGLFLFLALGRYWFSGAQLGAFGLVGCVATETLVISLTVWQVHPRLQPRGQEKNFREIFSFGLPLAYSSCLQQAIPLLITAIIGRLTDGALALAAFGVIRGFVFLLAGPMRNLQQTYLALVREARDSRRLLHFSLLLASLLSLLLLLVAGPLNNLILGQFMGVEPALRQYLAAAMALCAIFPFFYGGCHLLRGWFSDAEKTYLLGKSTIVKCCFMLLLWWPLVHFQLPVSGIVIAVFLLISAEGLEAGFLFLQRRHELRNAGPLAPLKTSS